MRSYSHFKISDRFTIFRMANQGKNCREIADALGRHHTAISRELKRHGGRSNYCPNSAQSNYARVRKRNFGTGKYHPDLREYILEKLKAGQSPDAIAGRLKRRGSKKWHVSHQTIYNWVRTDKFDEPAKKLLLFGKRGYVRRKNPAETPLNQLKTRVDAMPGWAKNSKKFGNWQGDTVIGAHQKGAILTTVECKSKFLVTAKLREKTKHEWATSAKNGLADFEGSKLRSLILDNGSEMNEFASLAESLQIRIFFAYPGCPWQKPLIENIHRMLRRFYPKGMPLDQLTDDELQLVTTAINDTPRKSLNYRTPREVLFGHSGALGG